MRHTRCRRRHSEVTPRSVRTLADRYRPHWFMEGHDDKYLKFIHWNEGYDDEDAVDVADNTKRRAALGNRGVYIAEAENPRLLARAIKWRLNESGSCMGAAREKRSLKIVFDVSPWADHLINEEKEVPPFARLCDRVSCFYGLFASQRRARLIRANLHRI